MHLLISDLSVFSTYVEVILDTIFFSTMLEGVLHVCGGDPDGVFVDQEAKRCSPRMWR